MANIYLVPEWFFGFSIGLELLFSFCALIVSLYAYKIYKLAEQRESKLLSISFLFISLSYLIKAILNLFLLGEAKEGVRALTVNQINFIGYIGIHAYIIMFTAGLIVLAYMTFKIKSIRVLSLLLAMSILTLVYSNDKAVTFNLISSITLFYIVVHYLIEYNKNRNSKTLALLIAFILLFLSGIGFIFAANYYINYVIGHLLELGSYLLILMSLILSLRKK